MFKLITKFLQCSTLTIALAFLIVPVGFAHEPLHDYQQEFNPIVGSNPTKNAKNDRAVGYSNTACQGYHYALHIQHSGDLWPPKTVGGELVYSYKEVEAQELEGGWYHLSLDHGCTNNCDNLKDHYIKCMEAAMTAANFSNVGWLVGIPVIGPFLGIAGLISAATSLGIGLHCNATKPSKEKCGELED